MNLDATNTFIDALKKWNERTKINQAMDMSSLTFLIGFRIGIRGEESLREEDTNKRLHILKERIILLINDEISETFLISSLTKFVTDTFEHSLRNHGDTIIFNETVTSKKPDSESFKKVTERVKSNKYTQGLKNDLYRWKEIVAIELSEEKLEKWEEDLMYEASKKLMVHSEKMREKYGNMTMREIYELESK